MSISPEYATTICLDASRAMSERGVAQAGPPALLALDAFVKGHFPQDHLSIVFFSYQALEIARDELPGLDWGSEWAYGTNIQHAVMVARRLLNELPVSRRDIILVTVGEPTAYFEPGSHVAEFCFPPTKRSVQRTLDELEGCTEDGITVTIFTLGPKREGYRDASAEWFLSAVEEGNLAQLNRCAAEDFEEELVRHYLSNRGESSEG